MVGCVVSLYLLYLSDYVGICLGHCDPFNYSLGLAWFFAGVLIDEKYVKLWSLMGIAGIAYFASRETIEGFCPYCTLLHLIGIASIALFYARKLARTSKIAKETKVLARR